MIENITTSTQYIDTFIPFPLFIIIFCVGILFVAIQLIYKPSAIFTATLGMVCLWCSAYASFVLGDITYMTADVATNNVTSTEIVAMQTIYTIPALLYFLIGIAALSTFNLFAAIFAYFSELEALDEDLYNETHNDFKNESWDEKV